VGEVYRTGFSANKAKLESRGSKSKGSRQTSQQSDSLSVAGANPPHVIHRLRSKQREMEQEIDA